MFDRIKAALARDEAVNEERLLLDRIEGRGFSVRFQHLRRPLHPVSGRELDMPDEPAYALRRYGFHISGRGGMTIATGEAPFVTASAAAVCSTADNFCKRTGRIIALRRLAETVGA